MRRAARRVHAGRVGLVGLLLGPRRAVVAGAAFVAVDARAAGAEPQSPEPAAWIVVDADTGEVLAAHNEHEALRPASTTKIMTALTAVERLDPSQPVQVSELAASRPPSALGISVGEEWPLETALASVLMVSANDMAYALAEQVGGGDIAAWEQIAASTGERLGMVDSTFHDPAGFDAEGEAYDGGSYMSAYDIAVGARNALAVPALAALGAAREYEFTWPGTDNVAVLENHNKLLPGGERAYDGATGFKTGYTEAAGHTFVGTAERGGRSLIVVILDTYDFYGWAQQLLDAGFATPAGAGTGATLPDVAVQPWGPRQPALVEFTALALGPGAAAASPTTLRSTGITPVGDAGDTDDPTGTTVASGDTAASSPATLALAGSAGAPGATEPAAAADDGGTSGGVSTTTVGLAVAGGLTVAFFARRRQIAVRKRKRAARRRATQLAMRRGTLPVADGRPLVHRRASSPSPAFVSDSHVRIVPMDAAPSRPPARPASAAAPRPRRQPARPAVPRPRPVPPPHRRTR